MGAPTTHQPTTEKSAGAPNGVDSFGAPPPGSLVDPLSVSGPPLASTLPSLGVDPASSSSIKTGSSPLAATLPSPTATLPSSGQAPDSTLASAGSAANGIQVSAGHPPVTASGTLVLDEEVPSSAAPSLGGDRVKSLRKRLHERDQSQTDPHAAAVDAGTAAQHGAHAAAPVAMEVQAATAPTPQKRSTVAAVIAALALVLLAGLAWFFLDA